MWSMPRTEDWHLRMARGEGTVNQRLVWYAATARMRALRVPPAEQERWKRCLAQALEAQPDSPGTWDELMRHPQRDAYVALVVARVPIVAWVEDGCLRLAWRQPAPVRARTYAEQWVPAIRASTEAWMEGAVQVVAWWREPRVVQAVPAR
jgi:hypothetical protein